MTIPSDANFLVRRLRHMGWKDIVIGSQGTFECGEKGEKKAMQPVGRPKSAGPNGAEGKTTGLHRAAGRQRG